MMALSPAGPTAMPDRRCRAGGRGAGVPATTAIAALATAFATVELWIEPHLGAVGLRSAIETAITLSAALSVILLWKRFEQTRLLSDLLLLVVLATVAIANLAFNVLPALSDSHPAAYDIGARMTANAVVGGGLAAAALAPARRRVSAGLTLTVLLASAGIVLVAVAEGVTVLLGARSPSDYRAAVGVVTVVTSCALVVAGIGFSRRRRPTRFDADLLAGASFLLASACLQKLVWPLVRVDWVTLADLPRVAAYALLLTTAVRLYGHTREQQARAAIVAERVRIGRDLHDGLAQDLAYIAAQSGRLTAELGDRHPLVIAAARALAASQQEILDLVASDAPNIELALREVAAELAVRFGVEVEVHVDERTDLDVSESERSELVRITREAIVNGVRHGGARHIHVTLGSRRSELLLRVSDDGCGIDAPRARQRPGTGLGMETMRARARLLGAQLVTRRRAGGGTDVEVLAAPVGGDGAAPRAAGRDD
jgi:signal transduction histidine kinase